jgi:hypothetical protein
MAESRSIGGLKTNSFVRRRKRPGHAQVSIEIEDFGHAEAILANRGLLREKVEALRRQGISPPDDGWGGWLGRYQKSLCQAEEHNLTNQLTDRQRGRRLPTLER